MIIWAFLVLKIVTIPIAYDFYLAFSNQEAFVVLNFNLFNVSKTIVLALLVIWDIGKELTDGIIDKNERRHYSTFSFLYCVSIFAIYIDLYGYDWSIGMYKIIFIGFGVIMLVKKLAEDTSKIQHIPNYRFLRKYQKILNNVENVGRNMMDS